MQNRKIKSIVCTVDQVRSILGGNTTFAGPIRPQPKYCTMTRSGLLVSDVRPNPADGILAGPGELVKPPFMEGDILFVREPWSLNNLGAPIYRADLSAEAEAGVIWRSPRRLRGDNARIFLRVISVQAIRQSNLPENLEINKLEDLDDDGDPWVLLYRFEQIPKKQALAMCREGTV